MSAPPLDLLVVGDCNPDLLLTGDDLEPVYGQWEKRIGGAELAIGGSASIMACGAARLGLATALVARVGDDPLGHMMRDLLAGARVDVSGMTVDPEVATGVTLAFVRGQDRAILTAPGTIAVLDAAMVDRELLRRARHMHVASYFLLDGLRPGLSDLVEEAHAAGLTVSVDPQGDPAEDWDGGLRALLPSLDILFVNEAEYAAIAPRGCPLVVVKRGSAGASAVTPSGSVHVAAPRIDVVDATGAGDSFDAGFLRAWLHGASSEEALSLGCACGALSATATGGTAGQPTLSEAQALLA